MCDDIDTTSYDLGFLGFCAYVLHFFSRRSRLAIDFLYDNFSTVIQRTARGDHRLLQTTAWRVGLDSFESFASARSHVDSPTMMAYKLAFSRTAYFYLTH